MVNLKGKCVAERAKGDHCTRSPRFREIWNGRPTKNGLSAPGIVSLLGGPIQRFGNKANFCTGETRQVSNARHREYHHGTPTYFDAEEPLSSPTGEWCGNPHPESG